MFILNQIVGVGGFSIVDNLRLIVIAVIFIGIIAVFLYLRFAKNDRKTNGKYISKEETGEDLENMAALVEGTKEEPVVNLKTIEERIKNSEAGIITKFAAVIKDLKIEIDTKLTAELEDIRADFTTKIEKLISKTQERGFEILVKDQDILGTPASFLQTGEDPVSVSPFSKPKPIVEKVVAPEEIEEEMLEVLSKDNADVGIEEKVSGKAGGDSADFDIQEFLDELENLPSEKDMETEK